MGVTVNEFKGIDSPVDSFTFVLTDMRVRTKAAAAGFAHSAALTENGDVYTWGNGAHGELGHSDTQVINKKK